MLLRTGRQTAIAMDRSSDVHGISSRRKATLMGGIRLGKCKLEFEP
jgi:hypothetical protein